MSFILDALKKSERERQKQSGPALFEVKVAPPRNRFPVWAVVIGGLLAVNVGVVLWLLLLRNPSKTEETREMTAANAPPAAAQQALPQSQVPYTPPASYNNPPAYEEPSRENSAANVFSRQRAANGEPSLDENAPPPENVLNPEDYEPAREAPQRAAAAPPPATSEPDEPNAPARSTSGVPTYQDAAALPGLNVPQLRLDLHVYDPEPANSFVFVNMQKLKQGDTFDQGVRVDSITPDGAILSYRGVRFLLRHE